MRVVDCSEDVVNHLRDFHESEEAVFSFDPDSPYAFPSIDALVPLVRAWAQTTSEQLATFYSPAEEEPAVAEQPLPKHRGAQPKRAMPSAGATRPKRVTTATLSSQLETVMGILPKMSLQLNALTDRQQRIEDQIPSLGKSPAVAISQPLSKSLQLPAAPVSSLAKSLQPPPRTSARLTHGMLASAEMSKPEELLALESEKGGLLSGSSQITGDALAQAVLAQSQALTSLVSQIANAQGDPMTELTSSGGAGARGATGRARLQAELAQQKGTFFKAVMQSMARRMSPTSQADRSAPELLERGISGVRYLERFGGYARQRELGQLQFQVMTAFDYMMAGQTAAAMDTIALLAVSIEQSCLDGGRMDLANLLCLQEDPPASIFVNRQVALTSRTRAFAPLADQRWVTVALAFLKEMEVISSKRAELVGLPKQSSETSSDAAPKAKGKAKGGPKKKGGGKGQAAPEDAE